MTDGGGQEVSDSKSDRNPLATSGLHDRKGRLLSRIGYRTVACGPRTRVSSGPSVSVSPRAPPALRAARRAPRPARTVH